MAGNGTVPPLCVWSFLEMLCGVTAEIFLDAKPANHSPSSFPWALIAYWAFWGFFGILVIKWRRLRSLQARMERNLLEFANALTEKETLYKKYVQVSKELEEAEACVKEAMKEKESFLQVLEAAGREAERSRPAPSEEIPKLAKEISETVKSLEVEALVEQKLLVIMKENLRKIQRQKEERQVLLQDLQRENLQRKKDQEKLVEEATAWKVRLVEVQTQKRELERASDALTHRWVTQEYQIQALREDLLKTLNRAAVSGGCSPRKSLARAVMRVST